MQDRGKNCQKRTVSQRDFPAPASENENETMRKSGIASRSDHNPDTVLLQW